MKNRSRPSVCSVRIQPGIPDLFQNVLAWILQHFALLFFTRMNTALKITSVLLAMGLGFSSVAQNRSYDVFIPIAKYMKKGDAEKLSAWFADNLEITVLSTTNDSSRNQARQIMKSFFNSYTPRSFTIDHKAGRSNMKYALGSLSAGGEKFIVTIFVSCKEDTYKIQQLKIERIE